MEMNSVQSYRGDSGRKPNRRQVSSSAPEVTLWKLAKIYDNATPVRLSVLAIVRVNYDVQLVNRALRDHARWIDNVTCRSLIILEIHTSFPSPTRDHAAWKIKKDVPVSS